MTELNSTKITGFYSSNKEKLDQSLTDFQQLLGLLLQPLPLSFSLSSRVWFSVLLLDREKNSFPLSNEIF